MLPVMQVRIVFLDLGDTLVCMKRDLLEDAVQCIASARGRALRDSGELERAVSELKRTISEEWDSRVREDFQWVQSAEDEYEYWRQFYMSVLRRLCVYSRWAELADFLARVTTDPESFTCFPDVQETLEELRGRGLELGVISNAFPSAKEILERLNLIDSFKYIILSYECGKTGAKPAPGIYRHALTCAEVLPVQAIFVDDRPDFVLGAEDIEMPAFLIDRDNQQQGWEGKRIRSLKEISVFVQPAISDQ